MKVLRTEHRHQAKGTLPDFVDRRYVQVMIIEPCHGGLGMPSWYKEPCRYHSCHNTGDTECTGCLFEGVSSFQILEKIGYAEQSWALWVRRLAADGCMASCNPVGVEEIASQPNEPEPGIQSPRSIHGFWTESVVRHDSYSTPKSSSTGEEPAEEYSTRFGRAGSVRWRADDARIGIVQRQGRVRVTDVRF